MKKSLIFVLLFTVVVFSAENKATVTLKDGSVIKGSIAAEKVNITSKFGKLIIPVASINSIAFGEASDPALTKKIQGLIENLASKSEKISEEAKNELEKIGLYAIDDLEKIASKDEIMESIASEVIDAIKDVYGDDVRGDDDVINAVGLNVSGTIAEGSFDLVTSFGKVVLNKKDIYQIDIEKESEAVEKTVKVPGIKVAAATDGYVNTGIKVKKGDKITIKASGAVVLASLSNLSFTPDGKSDQGSWGSIAFGALAGKIGDKGSPFLIGSKYSAKATDSGTLFLTISETLANENNTGEFVVKIKVSSK